MNAKLPLRASFRLVAILCAASVLLFGIGIAEAQSDNQPVGLTATVAFSRVTLRWHAPVRVTQPLTGYLVEAGASPGATAASLPVGSPHVQRDRAERTVLRSRPWVVRHHTGSRIQ